MNTEVYIASHKPCQVPGESCYIPIQVGAALHPAIFPVRDDTGDNISSRNPSFCELTALYWVWKNADADILGLVHYRRHFIGGRWYRDLWSRVLTEQQIQNLMAGTQLILPRKRHYIIETNYSQYAHAHFAKDLDKTREIIKGQCPEYLAAFDNVMAKRSGHRFNMLITHRDLLNRYCSWLFPILFELEALTDISGYDRYNQRLFGFIAERLLDVWVTCQGLSYREIPVKNMQGENWPLKICRFLKRKITASQNIPGKERP